MILSIETKRYRGFHVPQYNTTIMASNTMYKGYRINELIDKSAMIDIAEALFISCFQPEYNDRLKKRGRRS